MMHITSDKTTQGQMADESNSQSKEYKSENGLLPKALNKNLDTKKISNETMTHLIELFNSGNYEACAQLAFEITEHFPKQAFGWKVLGAARQNLGQIDGAFDALKVAAHLLPNDADAQYNFANGLYDKKLFEESIKGYQKTLKINPKFADAHFNLGVIYEEINNLVQAEKSFNSCLKLDKKNVQAFNHLGLLLNKLGRIQEAEVQYKNAIAIDPQCCEALNNLAILLKDTGRLEQSEAYYRKALQIDPLSPETHNNLGNLLKENGRFYEAELYFKKAVELNPTYDDAYCNLGVCYYQQGNLQASESAYLKALEINSENIPALSNYSVTLNELGQLKKAEACLKKANSINPNFIDVYTNATKNWLDQGSLKNAEDSIVESLKIQPNYIKGQSNLLFAINYSASHRPEKCLLEAKKYGEMVAKTVEAKFVSWQVEANPKRLKVGIVSGDLRNHSVAHFLKNVISHIDENFVELFAYSTKATGDEVTQDLKKYFYGFESIASLTDKQAAQKINQDGIHVLIDLSGHTEGSRLSLFGWKPAPVQAGWLGYFATTGLLEMDYFLVDEVSVPPENQGQFVETLKYLPNTRLCFTPPTDEVTVTQAPCVENGYVTFGCFQNMAKVNETVLDLWAKVLLKIPTSKFRWYCKSFKDAAMVDEFKQQFQKRGIELSRISLLPSVSRESYFSKYAEMDMILDTFPFPGGTTTCESLWMGVPTLTLIGDTLIARQGASVLTAAGLTDWIAQSKADYISKTIYFAEDHQLLNEIRHRLRAQVLASPLFNAPLFAKNFEQALWQMWHEKSGVIKGVENKNKNVRSKVSVRILSATRLSEQEFWHNSALGQSLQQHLKQDARLLASVAYNNQRGLSEVFNAQILQAEENAILVFIHDDVWIDQENFVDSVLLGLEKFDVIGVAGNKRILPNQPAWPFIDVNFTWDAKENLSGKVGHGQTAFGHETVYGAMPAACELMDGLFLAVKKQRLVEKNVLFDTQFDFHFYDLDFCRAARKAGLTLGTWPIRLTHQSGGAFGSESWQRKYQLYLKKWEQPSFLNALNADEAIYQQALQNQQNGNDQEATQLYQQVLQINAEHANTIHNLGYIEFATIGVDAALLRFEKAVTLDPHNEQFWVSYIDALMENDALDTAFSAIEHGQKYALKIETAEILTKELVDKMALNSANKRIDPQAPFTFIDANIEQADSLPEAWLQAYPQALMIEYTSRCNLRCKYCPKSNPGEDQVPGRNMDMTAQTVDAVIGLIKQYQYQELLLAGTGESTFHPDWLEDFPKMIAAGRQTNPNCYIHLNSNFAMKYEDAHWQVLAKLDGIVISIDTSDRQLTKEVRAKSDLGLIIYNIVRFKTYCEMHGLKLPKITINVTLYEAAAAGLPELMHLLANLPVSMVSISDLYEGRAALQNAISPISFKTKDTFNQVINYIDEASKIADALGRFKLVIQPHLVERLNQLIDGLNQHGTIKSQKAVNSSPVVLEQQTKFCLQPWTRFTLAADAAIFPCCVTDMESVGTINGAGEKESLNGIKLIQFRKDLLTGNVPNICVNCTNAAISTTKELQQAVHQLSIS